MDAYPNETGWKIIDSSLNEIIKMVAGTYTAPCTAFPFLISLETECVAIMERADTKSRWERVTSVTSLQSSSSQKATLDLEWITRFWHRYDQPVNPVDSSRGDGPFLTLQIQFDEFPSVWG
jgi:hypothetical protein